MESCWVAWKKLIYFLFGACEVSTLPAAKQLPCETNGISYKSSSLPGSLPAPLCPPQGHELTPKDFTEHCKQWFLLLLYTFALLCEGPELLWQVLDLSCSLVLDVRRSSSLLLLQAELLGSIAHDDCYYCLANDWGAISTTPFVLICSVMELLVIGGAGSTEPDSSCVSSGSDPVSCTVGSCNKHFIYFKKPKGKRVKYI